MSGGVPSLTWWPGGPVPTHSSLLAFRVESELSAEVYSSGWEEGARIMIQQNSEGLRQLDWAWWSGLVLRP
jgi:hypothetical protein